MAEYLAAHPRVTAVHYPGVTPATLDIARAQMPRGFGPLLSFELAGDAADAAGDKLVVFDANNSSQAQDNARS